MTTRRPAAARSDFLAPVPPGLRLPAALGLLAVVLALGAVVLGDGGGSGPGPARPGAAQEATTGELAEQFATHMAARRAAFQALVAAQEAEFPAVGDVTGESAPATAVRDADPDILALRVLPRGYREVDYARDPPLTYAAIELLERAERGEVPPLQVILPGGDQAHGALVLPLEAGDAPGLFAFLAVSPDLVRRGLAGLEPGAGRVAVVQAVPGAPPVELAARGPALEGVSASRVLAGTSWRLVYTVPGLGSRATDDSMGLGPILAGGAFGAAALAVVLVVRARRTARKAPIRAAVSLETTTIEEQVREHMAQQGAVDGEEMPAGTGPLPLPEVDDGSTGAVPEQVQQSAPDVRTASTAPATEPVPGVAAAAGPPAAVFRAYDIRGRVGGGGITPELAREVGLAVGSAAAALGHGTLVVGRDGRVTSDELATALMDGLQDSGRDLIDLGRVPTPVVYFACHYLDVGSGVMVTGSHNPSDYNGFKVMLGGEALAGDGVQALRQRIIDQDYTTGSGTVQHMDIGADYVRRISEDIPVALGNAYKLVVDCGNGVTGELAPRLYRALGHDVVDLYCAIDGRFPNHPPDPSDPANLEALSARVRKEGADLGFAFDGDGDRIAVVDGQGRIIWPDRLLMAYARDVLPRHPGAAVVFDVKSSNRLAQVIRKAGGRPEMWRSGHSPMRARIAETGAPLGGEMSGHIFFKERWYGFDDGLYAGARLLEILQARGGAPTAFFEQLPGGVATPELRVEMAEGEPFAFMARFPTSGVFSGAELTLMDGVRADYPDGWGLLRASNTTPSLVFRFEGDDPEALKRIQGAFRAAVLQVEPGLALPF